MASKKDEISLTDIYSGIFKTTVYLWAKKWRLVIFGVIGCALGCVYSIFKPVEYTSNLTFIVENSNKGGGLGDFSGLASSIGFSGLGKSNDGLYENQANLMSYLKSRAIVEEALLTNIPESKTTFAEEFIKAYGWRKDWKDKKSLRKIRFVSGKDRNKFTPEEDSVLFEMHQLLIGKNILEVSIPDEDGSILSIQTSIRSKVFARFFPEVLLDIVAHNYEMTKTKLMRENVSILEHQVDSVRTELNEALVSSASAKDQVFGLNPAYDVERVQIGKEQVNIQVTSMLLGELIKNLELARVKLMDQTPLIEVVDPPRYPLKKEKNSLVVSGIIFGIVGGIIGVFFLLGVRMIRRLHEAAQNNQ